MTGDQKRLFQHQIVVGRGVMVLQIASFCVSRNKTKREVDFKHGRLIGEYPAQLFAEVGWVDGLGAKIIPILQSVLATETGGDLWPVLPVRLSNIFVRAWNRVGRNVNLIRFPKSFPTGTCSCSGCLRGSWSSTRISRLAGSFRT